MTKLLKTIYRFKNSIYVTIAPPKELCSNPRVWPEFLFIQSAAQIPIERTVWMRDFSL